MHWSIYGWNYESNTESEWSNHTQYITVHRQWGNNHIAHKSQPYITVHMQARQPHTGNGPSPTLDSLIVTGKRQRDNLLVQHSTHKYKSKLKIKHAQLPSANSQTHNRWTYHKQTTLHVKEAQIISMWSIYFVIAVRDIVVLKKIGGINVGKNWSGHSPVIN